MRIQDEREGLASASSGERVYHCAGSKPLEDQAPEETPTDEAVQGDEIHKAKETDDFSGLDDEGLTIAQRLTAMEKRAYDQFVESTGEVPIALVEERLWIRDRVTRKKVASAKSDKVFIGTKSALSLDWKTGYLDVTPAYRNIQTRIQALAIWHEYPKVERVVTGIAAYRFKENLDLVDYDVETLRKAEQELFFHLWRAEQPYAERVPGPWCKYCRAKTFCPEAAAMTMLPSVPFGNVEIRKRDLLAKVAELPLPTLAFIHQRSPMIRNILDAVSDRLKGFNAEDLKSVGFQLVPSSPTREITDVTRMWGAIADSGLISLEEFQACLKASVGSIEALLAERIHQRNLESNPSALKKDAKDEAGKLMDPGLEYKPKNAMLKPLKALPE